LDTGKYACVNYGFWVWGEKNSLGWKYATSSLVFI
jgi:hypothetical protein